VSGGTTLLRIGHDAALLLWLGAALLVQAALLRARRRGGLPGEAALRARLGPAYAVEHAALAVLLASGFLLMSRLGWGPGHPRWLGVKLGLVAFVIVPLEAMHAWVNHVWIPRALREALPGQVTRPLERWIGMDDMVRALALLLVVGAVLPLIGWLSWARPF